MQRRHINQGAIITQWQQCLVLTHVCSLADYSVVADETIETYYQQASRLFGQAAARPPSPGSGLSQAPLKRQYAHSLVRIGRRDEAVQVWREVLKDNPSDPVAIRELRELTGE